MWDELLNVSERYLELHNDYKALEFLAEAQLMLELPENSISTLEKHANLFPDGRMSIHARNVMLEALRVLGKTSEALSLARELWKEVPSSSLLLKIGQLFICEGKIIDAISTVRSGINSGFVSPHLLFFIAGLITEDHPDEAFEYVKKAIQDYSEDPSVFMHAISLAFNTGHDSEAVELLGQFHVKFPDNKMLQTKSTTELIPMLLENKEAAKSRWQTYSKGQVPLHILLDVERTSMGQEFYWRWHFNKANRKGIPFMLAFGGRDLVEHSVFDDRKIFMDYTACLIAYQLNLFPVLSSEFREIVVSPSLLATIFQEIVQLKEIQPSHYKAQRELLSQLERIGLRQISHPEITSAESLQIQYSDLEQWIAAKEHEAYYVEDNFATEILEGRDVPEEIRELQIYPGEVFAALIRMGEVNAESVASYFNNKKIRENVVEILINNPPPLLVNSVFLQQLNQAGCLEIAESCFTFLVFESEIPKLKENIKLFERRKEITVWLERLLSKLGELKNKGKLVFCAASPSHDEDGGLTNLLKDALFSGKSNKIPIWCDERLVHSYTRSDSGYIVGVFDVLEFLFSIGSLTSSVYQEKLYSLYLSKVQYSVPTTNYVITSLKLAKVDAKTGNLRETQKLKILRQYIVDALSEHSLILKETLEHTRGPELFSYLIKLKAMVEKVLIKIWNESSYNLEWCKAASDWLYKHCFYFAGGVSTVKLPDSQIVNLMSINLSSLIFCGFQISSSTEGKANCSNYFDWLFGWMESYLYYNPDVKKLVINYLTKLIKDSFFNLENSSEQDLKLITIIYSRFIQNLPKDFQDCFWEDEELCNLLRVNTERVIIIEGLNIRFPLSTWVEWVERAVTRGIGHEGTEKFEDVDVLVTLVEANFPEQTLRLSWKDKQGEQVNLHILEPLAGLKNEDSTIRIKWLEEANKFLDLGDALSAYKLGLENDVDHLDFINDLETKLNRSIDYFFENLYIHFKNSKENIPKEIFPSSSDVFENQSPVVLNPVIHDWWVEYITFIEKVGFDKALCSISALPLGGHQAFSKILSKLQIDGIVDEKFMIDQCLKGLRTTVNPVKQQNLISYLLMFKDKLIEDDINFICKCLMNLLKGEINSQDQQAYSELYIHLLRCGWNFMILSEAYASIPIGEKILWSYIYADRLLEILHKLIINKDIPYSTQCVVDTFERYGKKLANELKQRNPLTIDTGSQRDVAHPDNASIWRTMFGGALSILKDYQLELESLKPSLLPILQELNNSAIEGKLVVKGQEEQFMIFDMAENMFFSNFGKNNYVLLQLILNEWGQKCPIFDPLSFALTTLEEILAKGGDEPRVLYYLAIVARQNIPPQLVDSLSQFIIKQNLSSIIKDEELLVQGGIIISLIKALPDTCNNDLLVNYKNELKLIMKNNPSRWELFVELSWRMSFNDITDNACRDFLEFLYEAASEEPRLKEVQEFIESLNSMLFWIPPQHLSLLHKLRWGLEN